MDDKLKQMYDEAIWVGRNIFLRNKTSGSSANMSFIYKDAVYITASGTCFGDLAIESFSVIDANGNLLQGKKPSKEYPLHLALYRSCEVKAVIHTHAFYSTLCSCYLPSNKDDAVLSYTPYLDMKLGKIKWISYAPPGTNELFDLFDKNVDGRAGYLLGNHGPIVGGKNLKDTFYKLEELEESCHVMWEINREQYKNKQPIKIR